MASATTTCPRCGEANSEFNVSCRACSAPLPRDSYRPPSARAPEHRHPGEPPGDFGPGTRVGRFEIETCVGRGAMGVVYRAVDRELSRRVALKFLSVALLEDEEAMARFRREARALSALDHPNVGAIHELAEDGGRPFLVLGLYEGATLRDRLEQGPLEIAQAVSVLRQLCEALAAAHRAGIIHRDVKPANVILTPEGRAVLVDFGLAKLFIGMRPGSLLTQAGAVLGTVAYMAPEQITSDAADHRADLWSIGVIGYEALTGRAPFAASSRSATASRVFSHEPPPARALRPEIAQDLSDLLSALLAKSADARVQTAAETARRLTAMAGAPT